MTGTPRFLSPKDTAGAMLERGERLYMLDFEQDDQRNVCRRVTSKLMLTKDKIESKKVMIVVMEGK